MKELNVKLMKLKKHAMVVNFTVTPFRVTPSVIEWCPLCYRAFAL